MADTLTLHGECTIDLAAAATTGKVPTINALVYSGGILNALGYQNTIVDLAGVAIPGDVPILVDHTNAVDATAGQGTVAARDGQLHLAGTLSAATSGGAKVIGLARDKVKLQASIGLAVEQKEFIRPGTTVSVNGRQFTAGPAGLTIVRRGRLREVSLLPIGGDPETLVTIAARSGLLSEGTNMSTTNDNTNNTNPDSVATLRANHLAEIDRLGRIAQICRDHPELHARAVTEGWTADKADFEVLKADMAVTPRIYPRTDRRPDSNVLEAAFCRSAGLGDATIEKQFAPEVLEAADRCYRGGIGIAELLMEAAARNGYHERLSLRGGNLKDVMQAAFLQAAGSTMSLPGILSNTANKFLLDGFMGTEQVWREICKITPTNDFKPNTRYRLTDSLEYDQLAPGGEIKHGTLGEESYSITAKTYARMLGLDRTQIINDDLGAFNDIRQRLGRGSGLKINSVFWKEFLDNTSFFTTARGNLQQGAATALASDGAALAAAERLFLAISDSNGHPLGIQPDRLLLPPALGVTGRTLFASQEVRDTTSSTFLLTMNIWSGRFHPLVSSYIQAGRKDSLTGQDIGGSNTHWFLLANPANVATMEVCFLGGQQSPTVESADADFSTLGIQFRGYHDFGVAKSEWRAGVKSDGTD